MPSPSALPAIPPTLPHTAPFRLVDRIVAADPDRGSLVAERRLTTNDALWPAESQSSSYFFSPAAAPGQPHQPAPAFPPTLIIEALCQAAACLNSLTLAPAGIAAPQQHHGLLVAIRDLKFPAFAYVGDTLTLEVQQKEKLGQVIAFSVRATVCDDRPAGVAPSAAEPAVQPREVASGRLLFAVTVA